MGVADDGSLDQINVNDMKKNVNYHEIFLKEV